ncbi:MAG: hypothetical protein GY906_14680, partial [bacterium]|nr:hypothetical protein [bacterium]
MRRRSRLTAFERHLFAFGLLSILIYCYLGEKVPWLAVHQVWPFVPLAGAELARTFSGRGGWLGRCVASVALATTVLATLTANFVLQEISPSHGRVESLHFVQTTPEFTAVAREGRHLALASDTEELAVSGEATWPLSWYWRDLRVSWSTPKRGTQPALAIVDAGAAADVLKQMNAGYRREVVPLRAWWLMEASMPSVREIIRFLIAREPWGHVGSTDVVVLRRLDSRGSSPIEETEGIAAIDLNLGTSRTTTHGVGWLGGPRGVAVRGDRIAVADTRLSRIALLRVGDPRIEFMTTQPLNEPEDVAWLSDESLLIADTWNHRVLAVEQDQGDSAELMKPSGGWYGPRSIAVSPSGRIAVADTGNRRIVLYPSKDGQPSEICCDGEVPGLNEPGGLAWIDEDTLLVCDTGNRRLLVVDRQCGLERSIDMSMAWSDYYARPQITVLERDRWLVSDT